MAKVSKKSETETGARELRFGCAEHPETKLCPQSCSKAQAE